MLPELLQTAGDITLHPTQMYQLDINITGSLERELTKLSGLPFHRIRAMTLADVVSLAAYDGWPTEGEYQQYIKGFLVLSKAIEYEYSQLKTPAVPWKTDSQSKLVCPDCLLSDEVPYIRLTWATELTTTCPVHGLRLVSHDDRRKALDAAWERGAWLPRIPEDSEDILRLDRMTSLAVTRKEVPLPGGRSMPGTTWLQFLRAFIDELMRVEAYAWPKNEKYEAIWRRAGYLQPDRSNLFNTFEESGNVFKRGVMRAAAAGIAMIMSGEIVPVKSKASVLSPRHH